MFNNFEKGLDMDCKRAVFIGYDPKEDAAAKMLANSIHSRTSDHDLVIIPIIRDELLAHDWCNRPIDPNGSTQFSMTRFMVPEMMDFKGVGLFLDCDMLITRDINELFDLFDDRFAVQCVQHNYDPTKTKMGGLPNPHYPRKNWSSVVLWNCGHEANRVINQECVETASPKYLHRFEWLPDHLIGTVPGEMNYLVGEQNYEWGGFRLPFNIHHTLGAPLFRDCQDVEFADYWKAEFEDTFNRPFTDDDIID